VIGEPRIHVEECESTQLLLLDPELPEGAVATADYQTGGRGRLGRRWVAPAGSAVLCSVLLRPPSSGRIAQLALVGGLAVAEAVEASLGLAAQIKWPNDVLVDRRKVAGVLAEARAGAVVLGVGINVNQTRDELPADGVLAAASLRTLSGTEHDLDDVLAVLLARLDELYGRWLAGGFEAVRDGLTARDFLRGREVTVNAVRGVAAGIDREGRLEIDVDGERRAVESGEVRLLR
jgi:BirA family transcriptional regulator, biotin operon repressor / biotin---[acetyl-CoA-carboxylase] ligase